jgi:hypothetical protein
VTLTVSSSEELSSSSELSLDSSFLTGWTFFPTGKFLFLGSYRKTKEKVRTGYLDQQDCKDSENKNHKLFY